MYRCSLATSNDVAWIRDVAAKRMLEEEVYKPQYYNSVAIENLINIGITNYTCWVAFKDDKRIGALGALPTNNFLNPEIRMLCEIFWWVDPEHRHSKAGLLLLNAFDKATSSYDEAAMSLLTVSEVMNNSLQKRGYNLCEYGFNKEM